MRKLYVLNIDSSRVDTDKLHDVINNSQLISNWSHYLPDSYIIQSESTATELSKHLRSEVGTDFRHYIFRLGKGYYGYMPTKQWSWLKGLSEWWDS